MSQRRLLAFQGAYYFVTGVWPLLHMPSFLAVTGRKTDLWLVRTVGLLVAASGLAFLRESRRREPSPSLTLLAAGQAGALAGIGTYYALKGTISKIYLTDAAAETALLGGWLRSRRRSAAA